MKKSDRICIVGGGVSGLSAAYYLEEKGYENVTVLEKEDEVGGKCQSIKYRGKTYELGAMMGVQANPNVVDFMNKLGVDNLGPVLYRGYFDRYGNPISQIKVEEIKEFQEQFFRLPDILKDYKDIWKPGFRNIPKELTIPFTEWCNKNGLPLVTKVYEPPFNSFGYGYLDETPAIYVLKFLNFDILNYFIEIDHLITLVDGLQELWKRLASTLNDVRISVNILEIERRKNIKVITEVEELEFDKLILACPLDESLKFLDAKEEETELFSKIKYNDFYVFAYRLDNIPKVCGYLPENFTRERIGHALVWYYRWQDMARNDLITVYTLGDETVGSMEVKRRIEEDLTMLGANIDSLYTYKKWKHFPHVDAEDIRNGFYDRLEDLQSQRNTYYTGDLLSFSVIEECLSYSKYLVNRFF